MDEATGQCIPPAECPPGQVKDQFEGCKPEDNQCPAGQIKSPEGNCLPGDGQCAAGEVRGGDGSCKRDSDGDGEADEGLDDGTFSGGENCNAPPQCAGDNILCGQAVIQWRIDCNTRREVNITGGDCSAPPICAGEKCNAMEYAQLVVSWRATCALERMGNEDGIPGTPGDGEDFDGQAEGHAAAQSSSGEDVNPLDLFDTCEGPDCPTGELDRSGYGYGSTCPTVPPISVMGTTINFNTGPLCEWVSLGSYFVLLFAGLASARIIGSA